MRVLVTLVLALIGASSIACTRPEKGERVGTSAITDTRENKPFGDIDANAIDATVNPCADFYAYACGNWTKTTHIPDDEDAWSRGFHEARAHDENVLREILTKDTIHPPADDPQSATLGDFFASCMDETALVARGDDERTKLLEAVDTHDADAIATTVAHLHLLGVPSLFVLEPEPDLHDARRVAAVLRQPPLDHPADALERTLSSALEGHAVFHDAEIAPQIVDARELAKITPHFHWQTYFAELGISPPSTLHVATPHYFAALDRVLTTQKSDELDRTLRGELSRSLEQGDHDRAPVRWKTCVRTADALLGDALAVAFARHELDDTKIERARTNAGSMRTAMRAEIDELAWMDEPTRNAARKKLDALSIAIGAPREKPDAHDDAKIGRASFLSDLVHLRAAATHKKLATIGQASDSDAWRFSGSTANAYFDPRKNELVIPAGILVRPIFDARDVHAFAFETILGHELTHALDGRFDENGNAVSWWSAQTLARYRERLACVRHDLEAAAASEKIDLHVRQILDESVADSGGLRLAYRAMKSSAHDSARDQAFFTAFAQLWCTELRPEALANFVADNPHPPPRVRVNRALRDLPELAKAFSCKEGDAMTKQPADRCEIW